MFLNIDKYQYYVKDYHGGEIYANRKDHNQKKTIELKSFSESMNEHRENLPF